MTSTDTAPTKASALDIIARIAASLLGSYALVWGVVSVGTVLGVLAGMPFGDAQTLLYLFAFLLFVVCFCWAFSARSVKLVWFCLAGGGALLTSGAWLLATGSL